jgi:hypothetical protein
MALLGSQLILLIGPSVPAPAPAPAMEALKSVEVTHQDEGRSGFQMTFEAGRGGAADLVDYQLLLGSLLQPWNRVLMVVTLGGAPAVLMDGVITHQQHSPSSEPGASAITVTGEDLSVLMDLKQKQQPWPAMPETVIALAIVGGYAQLGLVPDIRPATSTEVPLPTERTPVQVGTDLAYLNEMAARFAYVFYVEPGPVPGMSIAYWGPPKRTEIPQRALSVNLGAETNVDSIGFSYNALAPTTVAFRVQDRDTQDQFGSEIVASTRPPLAATAALLANQPNVRSVDLGLAENPSGQSIVQTRARAQAMTDASTDNVVTASGTLDASRYGGLLKPRGVVGVRGAGLTYDGDYYVKSVTHSISKGEYKQRFTITREGVVALTPAVVP